jgi:hypothetical protein
MISLNRYLERVLVRGKCGPYSTSSLNLIHHTRESVSGCSNFGGEVQQTQSSKVVLTFMQLSLACVSQMLMIKRGTTINGAVSLNNSMNVSTIVCAYLH